MSLDKEIATDIKPWIDFLDSMRVLGVSDQLPIPQIAVFGDQSSGKSSLLEALSGIPFPRGTGLVTRCPTCISLRQEDGVGWSAKIRLTSKRYSDIKEVELYNPEDISDKIAELTNILTDNDGTKLSSEGIFIRVTAPTVSNITIVDLPGIVRTTIEGQSQGVIREIDNLLEKIMADPKTVILCVIPANQDIATVDVLERAQRADPNGERTIGVLTKADLVDQGGEPEVMSVLRNVRKPLALGYIIVKNRSQAQLKLGLSLQDAMLSEDDFFQNHPVWHELEKNQRGIQSLSKKLTSVLVTRVKASLPNIITQIQAKLVDIEKVLHEMGPAASSSDDKRKILLRLVSKYSAVLRQIAEGDYRDILAQRNANLRIKYQAGEIIGELKLTLASRIPNFDSEAFEEKLCKCMSEMRGRELPGFLSAKLLMSTISSDLLFWRQDVDNVLLRIIEMFSRAAEILSNEMMSQFPKVNEVLIEIIGFCCNSQIQEINRRMDEVFSRGAEGAVNDEELKTCINQIRYTRFESAMRTVLEEYTPPDTSGTVAVSTTHTTSAAPAQTPVNPRDSRVSRVSMTGVATQPPAPPPAAAPAAASAKAIAASEVIEDAREYIRRTLGHHYMQLHGVDATNGFTVHIEDARMVLKAFWYMSENRLHTDVESTVDQMILQKISIQIEKELLSQFQVWCANGGDGSKNGKNGKVDSNLPVGLLPPVLPIDETSFNSPISSAYTLADMLAEDPTAVKKRSELMQQRTQYNDALKRVYEISPHSAALTEKNSPFN